VSLPERTSTSAPLNPVGQVRVRVRASDRVYDELLSAIRDLRIPPGATLSETDLAEQLQVSRTPLREAIARLVDNGLVSVVPQVGTRVERIRFRDVEEACFVRETLEAAAFGIACSHSSRDIDALRALLKEQKRAHRARDLDAFFTADESMHQRIFIEAGFPGAWTAIQPMKLQLDRLRRLSLPDPATVAELIEEHTAIIDALEAGDARHGSDVIRRHARRALSHGPKIREAHPELFTD